jgi:hypothetical protein
MFNELMETSFARAAALALRTAALAAAAFFARALRCSGVSDSILAFPPTFPPFLPICDMTALTVF